MIYGKRLLLGFLHDLFYLFTQLSRVNASDVAPNYFTLFVVEKSCGQASLPFRIDQINSRLGIRNIQQVGRHSGLHRVEKLRYRCFDVTHVVERDSDKLQRAWPVVFVDLYQLGKFIATRIEVGGPKVNQERMLSLLIDQTFESLEIDRCDGDRLAWFRGVALPFLRRRRETQQHDAECDWDNRFCITHCL